MHNIAYDCELKVDLDFKISYDENDVMKNLPFYINLESFAKDLLSRLA